MKSAFFDFLPTAQLKTQNSGPSLTKVNFPAEGNFFQVIFYRATPQTFGIQELIRTGSADHNMWLAGYAISKEMRIKYNEGLIKDDNIIGGIPRRERLKR